MKLRSLTWPERWCLCQALTVLPLTAFGLHVAGLRRVRSFLTQLSSGRDMAASDHAPTTARQIARLVAIAARYGLCRVTCLPTALTLEWLLRRQGIRSDLRLGVHTAAGAFEAHAWVEHEGVPLLEQRDVNARFVPIGPNRWSQGVNPR